MRTTKTTTTVKVSFVDFAHCNAGLIKLLKVIGIYEDYHALFL
jgi:hypothetical protein